MITRISLGLAIAAALPLAAQAHEAAAAATPDSTAAAAQESLVIVRDADTGKLRPTTAEEHAALKALPATQAVPGHGPERVDWPAGAADLERYLRTLVQETRQAV